ncbi:MAG: hypothetical protein APR53_09460 [Methanoculleus sp. SDB]|nr:MAG: hypothetical protein APR53_09460 [Methanoculleus sp. SDB]
MRNRIVKSGQEKMMNIPKEIQEYSYETYYYYFFHKYAPNNLKEHIERRWTHFAVGMTEIVAIIFALLFSLYIIIFEKHWELTRITYVIIIFSAFFSIICLYNALLSRRDALEMLDLWMYANFDGEGKCIFSKFEKEMSDKK